MITVYVFMFVWSPPSDRKVDQSWSNFALTLPKALCSQCTHLLMFRVRMLLLFYLCIFGNVVYFNSQAIFFLLFPSDWVSADYRSSYWNNHKNHYKNAYSLESLENRHADNTLPMIKRLSEHGWAPSCHGDTSSSNPLDIKLFIAMIQNWCFDIYLFILHFIYWYCSKYDISQICHICQLLTLKSLFLLNGKMFNLPTFYLTPRQRPVCTCGVWSLCLWAVYTSSFMGLCDIDCKDGTLAWHEKCNYMQQ